MQLLEVSSPASEQEQQLLGQFSEKLEELKGTATELSLSKALTTAQVEALSDSEDKAEAAIAALRRDPRDSFERNAAAQALKRFGDMIEKVRVE